MSACGRSGCGHTRKAGAERWRVGSSPTRKSVMEIVLIVVTVASLLVAAVMSVIASRTIREERRRSDARVATLAADIRTDDYARTSAIEPAARAALPLRDPAGASKSADLFARPPGMPASWRLPVFC